MAPVRQRAHQRSPCSPSGIWYWEMLDAEASAGSRRLTRRDLFKGAAGAAGLAALAGTALGGIDVLGRHTPSRLPSRASGTTPGQLRQFISRPDLHPPVVNVTGGDA